MVHCKAGNKFTTSKLHVSNCFSTQFIKSLSTQNSINTYYNLLTFYISNIKKCYKNAALYLSKKFVYFYE